MATATGEILRWVVWWSIRAAGCGGGFLSRMLGSDVGLSGPRGHLTKGPVRFSRYDWFRVRFREKRVDKNTVLIRMDFACLPCLFSDLDWCERKGTPRNPRLLFRVDLIKWQHLYEK